MAVDRIKISCGLDGLNREVQLKLFQPHHYAAFDAPKPDLNDAVTIAERLRVREALLQLDQMIWPVVSQYGWDLHRHRQATHYVSSDHFIFLPDGTPVVNNINSMWLHYGKSPSQLDYIKALGGYDFHKLNTEEYYNAFYLHTRIQFFINSRCFRTWLLLATDKNYYDRSEFLKKLRHNSASRQEFFNLLQPLFGHSFFYEIDSERLPLEAGLTEERMYRFVKRDRGGLYSGIVKEYDPEDTALEANRIGTEMIANLRLLYPLYDFMARRF